MAMSWKWTIIRCLLRYCTLNLFLLCILLYQIMLGVQRLASENLSGASMQKVTSITPFIASQQNMPQNPLHRNVAILTPFDLLLHCTISFWRKNFSQQKMPQNPIHRNVAILTPYVLI